MTKVLVVEDSALMRRMLRQILAAGGHEVVTARNGADALDLVQREQPDVVTMDINMPEMDGLTCLSRIMAETPKPVIMCSSLTEQGAAATFEALELGAVDFIHKPDGTVSHSIYTLQDVILEKVETALCARPSASRLLARRLKRAQSRPKKPAMTASGAVEQIVLVGSSTGGPSTLEILLSGLPAGYTSAVLIAQHMPAGFTATLARRLDAVCPLPVHEVTSAASLEPARVYLARGDADLIMLRRSGRLMVSPAPSASEYRWHPSVSRLAKTAMRHVEPSRLIGVQLTGMGHDGAAELTELRRAGGRTIAESEDSATVFGMPKALIELRGASTILPVTHIANQLSRWAHPARRQTASA